MAKTFYTDATMSTVLASLPPAWKLNQKKPKKRSENRRRCSMLAFRLLPEEYEQVRAEANRAGMTVSAYARSRIVPPGQSPDEARP